MRLEFITIADETVASYRYHCLIPMRELSLRGHEAVARAYPEYGKDAYVFSKHFNYGDEIYLDALDDRGYKSYFHCCDSHFGGIHDRHYRRMIQKAREVICSTPQMSELIFRETGESSVVIPDTYELPLAPAQCEKGPKVKVLWFGHGSNLKHLQKLLPLPDFCEFRMCTLPPKTLPLVFDGVPYLPWNLKNLMELLNWCDCVIIPSDPNDERQRVKSPNRVMETVRRGRFVIASPLPSYLEFGDMMHIGDVNDGLECFRYQDPDFIRESIVRCQNYIEEKYSPSKIGALWEQVLQS